MLEYTPQNTSDQLVASAQSVDPSTIADFCAGKGSLLEAARRRWPSARLYANDVDPSVRNAIPNVHWLNLDFLSEDFDKLSTQLPRYFDVILLNPPFCFERSQGYRTRDTYAEVQGSIAFAFMFKALKYLNFGGELLAVMPTSTLQSERDSAARRKLKEAFNCNLISQPSYGRFPGLDVSTYLLHVRSRKFQIQENESRRERELTIVPWQIRRGTISIRRNDRKEEVSPHGWIHTTSIRNSNIVARYELPQEHNNCHKKFFPKNCLVLPRVGKVRLGDILVTSRREVLSDCLIGVTFQDCQLPMEILWRIKHNFSSFSQIYSGTGAPYTTQTKISDFIQKLLGLSDVANVYSERDRTEFQG